MYYYVTQGSSLSFYQELTEAESERWTLSRSWSVMDSESGLRPVGQAVSELAPKLTYCHHVKGPQEENGEP